MASAKSVLTRVSSCLTASFDTNLILNCDNDESSQCKMLCIV